MNKLVTNKKFAEWAYCKNMELTEYIKYNTEHWPNHPVTGITHEEAAQFCKDHNGRLPRFEEVESLPIHPQIYEWLEDGSLHGGIWFPLQNDPRNAMLYRSLLAGGRFDYFGFRCVKEE